MAQDKTSGGEVPHSSGRNKYATKRTSIVFGAIVGFVLLAIVALVLARVFAS